MTIAHRLLAGLVTVMLGCGMTATAKADALKDLAPTGKLRAAINLGNSVLAQDGRRDRPADRHHAGPCARPRAAAFKVPVELVPYNAAGKVFDAVKKDEWDIAFVAIEPVRAAEIEFSAPYVIIEGTYMVPKDS